MKKTTVVRYVLGFLLIIVPYFSIKGLYSSNDFFVERLLEQAQSAFVPVIIGFFLISPLFKFQSKNHILNLLRLVLGLILLITNLVSFFILFFSALNYSSGYEISIIYFYRNNLDFSVRVFLLFVRLCTAVMLIKPFKDLLVSSISSLIRSVNFPRNLNFLKNKKWLTVFGIFLILYFSCWSFFKNNDNYTTDLTEIRKQGTSTSEKELEVLDFLNYEVTTGDSGTWFFDDQRKIFSFVGDEYGTTVFNQQINVIVDGVTSGEYNEGYDSWKNMQYSLSQKTAWFSEYLNEGVESSDEDYTTYYLAISDINDTNRAYLILDLNYGDVYYDFVEEINSTNQVYINMSYVGPVIFIILSYCFYNRKVMRQNFISNKKTYAPGISKKIFK